MKTWMNYLGKWFVFPHPDIKDPIARLEARFLSPFLLVLSSLTGVGLFFVAIGNSPVLPVLVMALISQTIAYIISRTKWYRFGAMLSIASFSFVPFMTIYIRNDNDLKALLWIFPPLILAQIFFRSRDIVFLGLVYVAGFVWLISSQRLDVLDFAYLSGIFVVVFCLVLITVGYYQRKEKYRLKEIRQANEQLEARVEERTTDLLMANQQLEEARRIAEAANQSKSQFLASMSHELRTPLAAIIGYSEMLEEQSQALGYDKFTPRIHKITVSANHLLSLISDVLDISKIEAGRTELYMAETAFIPLIDEVLVTATPLIQKNNNHLVTHISPEIDTLFIDEDKLSQVLLNLLSNAAKFTKNGTITLQAKLIENNQCMEICVQDTGIGMTQEQTTRIFEPFVQADASTTRQYGGTGLGLAISQEFCKLMGGHIRVISEIGEGSQFIIHLPYKRQTS